MNVTLVQPPLTLEERYGIKSKKSGGETIPLGIAYLASVARAAGHLVNIIDAEILNLNTALTVEKIMAENPAVVGFTAVTISVDKAAMIAREIKRIKPDIITLIGGHHLSTVPEETLKLYPEFDFGIIGEGENTFVELLSLFSQDGWNKDQLKGINGLIYKSGRADEFIITSPRARIINLDILPQPAFDLLPDLTMYSPPVHTIKKFPAATLVTSRGCPGQCTFCTRSVYGNILSAHSAEYMVESVLLLYHKYGIREIQFRDDNFTAFKPRLYKFCHLLKEKKITLVWTALARVDMVEPEMLKAMKAAGCWQVWYGVESGNDNILKLVKKNITKEQIRNAVNWTKQAGIDVGAFFIMGHPGETVETIKETIDFTLSLNIDEFHCTLMTPFPGLDISGNYAPYGTFEKDWKKMTNWQSVYVPFGLKKEDLEKYNRLFFRKFYFRPRIIWNHFKRLRSPRHFKVYFLGFLALCEWIFVSGKQQKK